KRRGRTAAALALVNRANAPVGGLNRSLDFGGIFAVRHGRFLVAHANEPRRDGRRLVRVQIGVTGPVLFLDKSLDLAVTLNDQPQGHGLHSSGGYSPAP